MARTDILLDSDRIDIGNGVMVSKVSGTCAVGVFTKVSEAGRLQ
jgi:hypothetical protein